MIHADIVQFKDYQGEWEVFYLNGEKIDEGHSLDPEHYLGVLANFPQPMLITYRKISIEGEEAEAVGNYLGWGYPNRLEDLLEAIETVRNGDWEEEEDGDDVGA